MRSDLTLLATAAASRYAEAVDARPGALERATARLVAWLRRDGGDLPRFAAEVAALATQHRARGAAPDVPEAARTLRARGLGDDALVPCFALVSEAHRHLHGSRLAATEIMAARAVLAGRLAALADGAARTRAALVAAAAAALAGLSVHVLLPHGELARRRAAAAEPLLGALGLTAGVVTGDEPMDERRAAYRQPIVFADAREAATDHLRDRLVLRGHARALELEVEALAGRGRLERLLHGGLHFAIVEDAARVLVEDAQAPLAIFGAEQVPGLTEACRQALDLAGGLAAGQHYVCDEGAPWPELTAAGREQVAGAAALGGVWSGTARRELLAAAAIATGLLEHGRHYAAHGGRILAAPGLEALVPEEATQALVRMLELKEGCDPGETRRQLARIAPERFHRRYLRLGGCFDPQPGAAQVLSATCGKGLAMIDAPRRAPAPAVTMVAGAGALVATAIERAAARLAAGAGVVVVAPDADRADAIRAAFERAGIAAGCSVVDERALALLDPAPVHVLVAGVLPSRRAQARVLAAGGALLAAEDDPLIGAFATAADRRALAGRDPAGAIARIQRRAERAALRARANLRKLDDHLGEALAYAGRRV